MTTKTRTINEEAERELSRPHASYEKEDYELLLKLLQRMIKEIDSTNLPQDPRSRRFVVDLWRAELTGYRNILAGMVEGRGDGGGSQPNHSRFGTNKDADLPNNSAPFIERTRIPDKPTLKLPGPSKRGLK